MWDQRFMLEDGGQRSEERENAERPTLNVQRSIQRGFSHLTELAFDARHR